MAVNTDRTDVESEKMYMVDFNSPTPDDSDSIPVYAPFAFPLRRTKQQKSLSSSLSW